MNPVWSTHHNCYLDIKYILAVEKRDRKDFASELSCRIWIEFMKHTHQQTFIIEHVLLD